MRPDEVHGSWRYRAAGHGHHMLGEHKRELEIVRRGLEDYPDLPLLRASEVAALAALHRVDEAREIVDRSTAVASEYGSPFWVMEQAAQELRAHGHLEESIEIANFAVDWCRSRPVEEMETEEPQYYLASALYLAERWDEARAVFEELAARSPDDFDYLGAIGTLAARQGDREEALRISAELESLDRPHMFGTNIYWCACISAILGEKEQALAFLREAFSRGLQHYGHVDLHADMDLESLRDYPPFGELVRPKG